MALYRVTLFKNMPDHPTVKPWSNVYYCNVADLDAAIDFGEVVMAAEADILKEYVQIYKISAVQPFPLHQPGASKQEALNGTVVGDFALMLPLFNAVRITFSDGVGRPSQKYFRCPLQEDEIEGGALIPSFIDDINANYSGVLLGVPNLVSNSGDSFTDIICQAPIQMRQVDWHRRTRPGFHRGWVADE